MFWFMFFSKFYAQFLLLTLLEFGLGKTTAARHFICLETWSLKVYFYRFIVCLVSLPGTFKLLVEFTEEYPNKPPTVRFVSKMFHPNGKSFVSWHIRACLWSVYNSDFVSTVYADGSICLDILQNRWSPTYDVSSILTSIQVILLINADQPLILFQVRAFLDTGLKLFSLNWSKTKKTGECPG